MAGKRVLFFDGVSIEALAWQSGQVVREQRFSADPVGFEAFSAYLASDRASLVYVLADVGEEGFQLETIPAVQGGDRDALIKRRLGQFFFGTPYSLGLSLGRNKEGRRDERMLFAALTRPESLTLWLDLIQKADAPLAGVYSIPLVLAENAQRMVGLQSRFLLVSLSSSGLRQSFFNDGNLQFSRLSQLATDSREEFAVSCNTEANKTYQYLAAQRQITRNSSLTACVVAHTDDLPELREHCRDSGGIQFQFIDIAALAKTSGLKSSLASSHSDALFAQYLLTRTPKVQFAPTSQRKLYRLWQIRVGLRAASLAVVFGSLVMGGRLITQWTDLQSQTAAVNTETSVDSMRYQSILDGLPKTQLTSDNLRAVIASVGEITRRSPGPLPLLTHLSESLEVMPAISLQRLEWKLLENGKGITPASPSVPNGAPGALVALDIQGHLPIAVSSDQRMQIEMVESLAARLRVAPITVDIVNLPVDIESGKALKRGAVDSERPSGPPSFELRLTQAL